MPRNTDLEALAAFPDRFEGEEPLESCPMAQQWRLQLLRLDKAAGVIRVRAVLNDDMLQGAGVVQGGVASGIMDHAMAMAVVAGLDKDQSLATITLTVEFKRPLFPGPVECVAEISAPGRRVVFTRARLFDEDGRLAGLASASSLIVAAR